MGRGVYWKICGIIIISKRLNPYYIGDLLFQSGLMQIVPVDRFYRIIMWFGEFSACVNETAGVVLDNCSDVHQNPFTEVLPCPGNASTMLADA